MNTQQTQQVRVMSRFKELRNKPESLICLPETVRPLLESMDGVLASLDAKTPKPPMTDLVGFVTQPQPKAPFDAGIFEKAFLSVAVRHNDLKLLEFLAPKCVEKISGCRGFESFDWVPESFFTAAGSPLRRLGTSIEETPESARLALAPYAVKAGKEELALRLLCDPMPVESGAREEALLAVLRSAMTEEMSRVILRVVGLIGLPPHDFQDDYKRGIVWHMAKLGQEELLRRLIADGASVTKWDWMHADPDFTVSLIIIANYRDGDHVPADDLKTGLAWEFIRRSPAWWPARSPEQLRRFPDSVRANPTCPEAIKQTL